MKIEPLVDSAHLLGDAAAIRKRWDDDGVLFMRGVVDRDLVHWAEGKFREKLADEALIDPAVDQLVWTGNQPITRRPCDAIGTEVWHKFVELPLLNDLMRIVLNDEPIWIPIVGHRSSLPTGPIVEGQDIFQGRHQDSYFSKGMHYVVCWMPMKDAALDAGSFAVAPGRHKEGNFYHDFEKQDLGMWTDAIADAEWRSADFEVGDLLMFDFYTPHATLPNPSNLIRISLDVRAVAASAPRPVVGTVESVDGVDVMVRTEDDGTVKVHITDETYIRDMNPFPRIPTAELQKIAYPGAHIMATMRANGEAVILRRNFY